MENNNLKNKFYWIYLIGFFLIASLPLLAVPPLFHPAPWGKTIIFRIILSILIFFFVYQIAFRKNIFIFKKLEPKAVKLILGILALLFSLSLLSTILSQDIGFSFWGSPLRAGGFLIFSFYIILSISTFLIVKDRDWKKIWDFSILIGILTAVFGICQYFKLFPSFIVSMDIGIASTMGASGLFALYLSFLFFLALPLGLEEPFDSTQGKIKRIYYFLAILLFIFGIFISSARAVYLGVIIGLFFFFFFYPVKLSERQVLAKPKLFNWVNPKKIGRQKIVASCFLILAVLVTYYFNVFPTPPNFIKDNALSNKIFSYLTFRLSLKTALVDLTEARFSAWKVGLGAIKERPILGWGPENFSVGFDKYYDPTLPQIATLWWDRAHNFLIEYAVTFGIPFLIAYLMLVGVLFWQLQKIKKRDTNIQIHANDTNNPIIAHGIQSAFIAYLVANLFSFDGFDTYLLFFLLTGYCLHLISSSQNLLNQNNNKNTVSRLSSLLYKRRKIIVSFLFIFLIWYIWFDNLKPLFINKELNLAEHYSTNNNCQKAIDKMEKVLPSHSIIDHYVMLEYSDVLKECQRENPEQENEFIQKSIQTLEEAAKLRPTYTRTWLLLGSYYYLFVADNPNLKSEEKEALLSRADSYFKKAAELSPRRQEIFLYWSKIYLIWGKYNEAKEKAEQCIEINDNFGGCYWQKALANILLQEPTQAKENMEKASQKQFNAYNSSEHLSEELRVYLIVTKNLKEINIEYYRLLADIYKGLLGYYPRNAQYHASLSFVYKTLGEYEKAGEQAVEVFKLQIENKVEIEKFMKSLISLDFNSPKLHTFLAYIYTQTGETEKAKEEFLTIKYLYLQLIADNPKTAIYHFYLARVYKDLGEYEKAKTEAQKFIELSIKLSPDAKDEVDAFLKTLP